MKYNNITILGLGSLGGYIAKSISDFNLTRNIIIIDNDKIEEKNLKTSIYKEDSIGKFKCDCLKEIINDKNKNINVTAICNKYELSENYSFPKFDNSLTIDCRDFTYNRKNDIDVRLYISSRYLVIDCRKEVINETYNGAYISQLSKDDIKNACFNFCQLINKDIINTLIEKEMIYELEIDYLDRIIYDKIYKTEKSDVIVCEDSNNNFIPNKFLYLEQYVNEILESNKKNNLHIFIGDKSNPICNFNYPPNTINNLSNILCILNNINIPNYNYYIINLKHDYKNNTSNLELIPETGAA